MLREKDVLSTLWPCKDLAFLFYSIAFYNTSKCYLRLSHSLKMPSIGCDPSQRHATSIPWFQVSILMSYISASSWATFCTCTWGSELQLGRACNLHQSKIHADQGYSDSQGIALLSLCLLLFILVSQGYILNRVLRAAPFIHYTI